ncbi:enoyl-CoA hydratase/isomerase family protein [Bradyrhizobium sp. LHD-71]|uniref:enoyl-CoA hydratase/isomerase family protein n=1 Tax=Bradyrhizobium sp. LHD-71 TaxID=3072141 RepID=UPI0028108D58|nr:enoyl-CoA hydratase/isomerase family protein [Bradyrhizobium sp. LHD-71]MDQ8728196.1 enoyl-CoA hydratase/isomerase family protein [Bradyrhizobium sp. LHD-71]
MAEHVVISEAEGIVRFELNRPDKMNSVDNLMARQLLDACEKVDASSTARCIIVSGRGRAFCGGADLAAAREQPAEVWVRTVSTVLQRIKSMPCPVITAIHGYALGLGAGLAMCGDLVIADETAKLGFPEVHHGLVPGVIAAAVRPLVSERALAELLFIGDKLTAEQARGFGLVSTVVPSGGLAEASEALARRLMHGSPTAMRLTKKLMQQMKDMTSEESYRAGEAAVLVGRETEDAKEGMSAFKERRQPVWSGR